MGGNTPFAKGSGEKERRNEGEPFSLEA